MNQLITPLKDLELAHDPLVPDSTTDKKTRIQHLLYQFGWLLIPFAEYGVMHCGLVIHGDNLSMLRHKKVCEACILKYAERKQETA